MDEGIGEERNSFFDTVQSNTIDHVIGGKLDMITMDIKEAELDALKGAAQNMLSQFGYICLS